MGYPSLVDSNVILRLHAPGAAGENVMFYITDKAYTAGPGTNVLLSALSPGWTDVTVPVGSVAGAYDPRTAYQLTMDFSSGSQEPWTNPTVLYIDSIRSTNGVTNDTFDASLQPMGNSTLMALTGSTMTWVSVVP